VVIDEEEGRRIAECAGPTNKSVILQNHGLITMTTSIEGTIALFKLLEETCQCQLLSYSAATGMGIKPVPVSKSIRADQPKRTY
jgi:ribulose-5-phosphate 4-epimerase/fuculose-1-phosphate aldolase